MIYLTYADAFFIYLLLWLLLLGFLWYREDLRLRRHRWKISGNRLFNCDKCHHAFIHDEPVNICRCPKCNAICFRRKSRD